MKVIQLSVEGHSNIGLYGFATNTFCLVSNVFPDHDRKQIEKILKVPTYKVKVGGSVLVGALVAGNSRCLLLPNIVLNDELAALEKIIAEINEKHDLSMKIAVVPSKLTALGNNILCNDRGCLVHLEYSADVKKIIRQALGVSLHPGMIAGVEVVGSCVVHTSRGAAIHRDASPEDIAEVESLLGIPVEKGTVNVGSPYLRSAVLCNDHGLVVGDALTGIEIEQLYESLGFLNKE